MAQNEDIPYVVSDVATPDRKEADPDEPNKSILLEVQKYLQTAIKTHNTFDVIETTAKLTVEQQVEAHKVVVRHLRNVKSVIDNKVKELR